LFSRGEPSINQPVGKGHLWLRWDISIQKHDSPDLILPFGYGSTDLTTLQSCSSVLGIDPSNWDTKDKNLRHTPYANDEHIITIRMKTNDNNKHNTSDGDGDGDGDDDDDDDDDFHSTIIIVKID